MAKRILVLLFCCSIVLMLAGCATARKQKDLEIQGLRNQVSVLEAQLQSKDEELNSLRESLTKASEEKAGGSQARQVKKASKKRVIGEVKSRPNAKQIQIALANAGYNPGAIDGHTGKQTRDAIRAFQRANNLAADGKVGKQTWALLKEYLYKKIK